MPTAPTSTMDAGMGPREQERELLHEAADAVGALMEFWGFKRVMGRIWALLYLRGDELSASELCDQLSISSTWLGSGAGSWSPWSSRGASTWDRWCGSPGPGEVARTPLPNRSARSGRSGSALRSCRSCPGTSTRTPRTATCAGRRYPDTPRARA